MNGVFRSKTFQTPWPCIKGNLLPLFAYPIFLFAISIHAYNFKASTKPIS